MLGAIIGDIVGSRFEKKNLKDKDFELFTRSNTFTDDSILTLAISKALRNSRDDESLRLNTIKYLKEFCLKYEDHGFGEAFLSWARSDSTKPYNSYGNGSAMRVSAVVDYASSLEEAILLSDIVTGVTHNHEEGIKGARAITSAIYLAKLGRSKAEIKDFIEEYFYSLDFTIDSIRESYHFDATCIGSVPEAIVCFLESRDFEDALRIAVSLGGDSDTIACMTGSIAEAYYGVPKYIEEQALTYLDSFLLEEYEKRQEN